MKRKPETSAVVIGLGRSGMAAVRFLLAHEVQVAVSESRAADRLSADDIAFLERRGVPLETGGHTPDFCLQGDLLVPSPGVPLNTDVLVAAGKKGIPVAGELAIVAGYLQSPVIAVTGTNGKTTVTGLIGELLRADGRRVFVGGNIGTPVLEYLLGSRDADVIVLEVSSFQLEIAGNFRPDIALFLNLTADHLDRHGSMKNYLAAKQNIFAHQKAGDTAILGGDDPVLATLPVAADRLLFGTGEKMHARVQDSLLFIRTGKWAAAGDETYSLKDTCLDSHINRLNAAAAVLAARSLGCRPESIRRGLDRFTLSAHRMEAVAAIDGVFFTNDSKATNIGSMQAAIASIAGPVILIAGGRNKGCDFTELAASINGKVKKVLLIGETADRMNEVLRPVVVTEKAAGLVEAVLLAKAAASPGDTVLLAPGCASFDMFEDYAHRGDVFKRAVMDLQHAKPDNPKTDGTDCRNRNSTSL